MNETELKNILEAVLFAAEGPLNMNQLLALFPEEGGPDRNAIRQVLDRIRDDYASRSIELKEVGSGYRFQVRQDYAQWVSRLWEERPARYSRATLETLALIAYRQPITRGEIEEVRGVSVSSQIIKSLMERDWIRIVGHRDVPGKPALYATTKAFLDYFNLRSLDELPTLAELRDIDAINAELDLGEPGAPSETGSVSDSTTGGEEAAASGPPAPAIAEHAPEPAAEPVDEPMKEPVSAES